MRQIAACTFPLMALAAVAYAAQDYLRALALKCMDAPHSQPHNDCREILAGSFEKVSVKPSSL